MKLTKKQIDIIINNTPAELHGKSVGSCAGVELGYYQPAGANWAYHAQFVDHNGAPILVAIRFGHIM